MIRIVILVEIGFQTTKISILCEEIIVQESMLQLLYVTEVFRQILSQ